MSNFKAGEKVVWISDSVVNQDCIIPKKGDIVTLKKYIDYSHWDIVEFPFDKNGKLQCLHEKHFRKLDHQFSEDVIAEIIKQVKEESLTLAN